MAKKKPTKITTNLPLEIFSIAQLSKLGMTFWVGGTLTIGSIIIPLLFKMLDQITAATITGQILNLNAYIGIVAVFFAIIDSIIRYRLNTYRARKFWYLIIIEIILTINNFAIFPLIAKLRTKLADMAHHVIQTTPSFNFWHSISAGLFVITVILGLLYTIEK